MKKNYLKPLSNLSDEIETAPLCGSTVTGNNGIGYGGTDKEGEIDPDAREREDMDFFDMLAEQELVDKQSLW